MARRSKFAKHGSKPGVPKYIRYREHIDSIESDMKAAVEAYGPHFIAALAYVIHNRTEHVSEFISSWAFNRSAGLVFPNLSMGVPVLDLADDSEQEPIEELFPDLI